MNDLPEEHNQEKLNQTEMMSGFQITMLMLKGFSKQRCLQYLQEKLKSKSSTVERVKIGVPFKVKAVEVRRVGVLAAGVEGARSVLTEAPRALADLRASAGQR